MTPRPVKSPWLSVVGVGDDGARGLSPIARRAIENADMIFGAKRQLAGLGPVRARTVPWGAPFVKSVARVRRYRGRSVVVLATGDPMWYGIARTLLRTIPAAEMRVIPSASAFSLAAARLGWLVEDVETVSAHSGPTERIIPLIQPGARILALCKNGRTPAAAARILVERGFGPSRLTALSHMDGPKEKVRAATAARWRGRAVPDLTTLAIECIPSKNAQVLSSAPGLPDNAFQHDGNMTKRDVRAVTLCALAPQPFGVLWDIGAGCGAVSVEWCRAAKGASAFAVEPSRKRLALIEANALALGAPGLNIVPGRAPAAYKGLAPPDAVFIGGGVAVTGVLEGAWRRLNPLGRLVANAVTLEGEARLQAWREKHGGELVRIEIAYAEPLGGFHGWRPQRPVTQWRGGKS